MFSETSLQCLALLVYVLSVLYSCIVLKFSDLIFKKERKPWHRLLISAFNLLIGICMLQSGHIHPGLYYLVIYLVLYLEFFFSYKSQWNRLLLIVAVFGVHIMAVRTAVLSVVAWANYSRVADVVHRSSFLLLTTLITLALLIVATLIVMHTMPAKKIRLVLRRDEQTFFLTVWLIICTLFLLINTQVYRYDPNLPMIYQFQILSCFMLLTSIYIMIFYSFTTCTLLHVKDENKDLRAEVENQENFVDALTGHAQYHYEVNLTKNHITKGFSGYERILAGLSGDYSRAVSVLIKKLVHPEDCDHVTAIASVTHLLEEYKNDRRRQTFECRLRDATGQYYWTEFIISLIKDCKTGDIMAFAYFLDIDNDKKAVLSLQERAERDCLTGLYNKMTTEALITPQLAAGMGVLIIIDVDNFKSVNDSLGHAKGDEVLRQLARELRSTFRTSDIVGRIGGDEFMVYLPTVFHRDPTVQKAEEVLRRFFKAYVDSTGNQHYISASIGIAMVTSPSITFLELYKQADAALYYAKNKGKNTFHIYKTDDTNLA